MGFNVPSGAWPAWTIPSLLAEQVAKEVSNVTVKLIPLGSIRVSVWGPSVGCTRAERGFCCDWPRERLVVLTTLFWSLEGVIGFVDNLELLLGTFVAAGLVWVVLPGKREPRLPQIILRSVFGHTEDIVEGSCSYWRHCP